MKRVAVAVLAVVFVFFGIGGCSDNKGAEKSGGAAQASVAGPVFRSISPQEAKSLMGQRPELLLVDLRDPQELYEGYISGSQLVPFMDIARGRLTLPAGRPLLLICAVGGRSYAVGQYFYRQGYPEIYNLQGGISAWKKAGLPVEYR